MDLAIISHTEHYRNPKGSIVGWGPTVREINHLLEIFDTIYHVAMFHDSEAPESSLPYFSDRIIFVALPALGGKSLWAKGKLIWKSPKVLITIHRTLKQVDYFQFRAPTGIGVYVIPYLNWFVKTPGWYKYAGNWKQNPAPLGYRIQRYLLKNQSRVVTLNGIWDDQKTHCLSFENPCLGENDVEEGLRVITIKEKGDRVNFCYVGRLEKQKGVERIIKAFNALPENILQNIGKIHLVGNGNELPYFEELGREKNLDFVFHGFLSTKDVHHIYKQSHFFLMPTTASEGFPKVIAEAMNFGCIPMVSSISSISQYVIDGKNGFLIDPVTIENVIEVINKGIALSEQEYKKMLNRNKLLVKKFTFQYYINRIKELIQK